MTEAFANRFDCNNVRPHSWTSCICWIAPRYDAVMCARRRRTTGICKVTVGTATLAAFIGAGGLGVPIVAGLQLADTTRILSGALPAAALALIVDRGLAGVERLLRPRGMD